MLLFFWNLVMQCFGILRTIVAISVIVDWHYTGTDKEPKDGCAGFIGQQAMAFSLGLNIFGFILLFISRKSIGRLKVGLK